MFGAAFTVLCEVEYIDYDCHNYNGDIMGLRNIDVVKPTKEEAVYILKLLDGETRKYHGRAQVVVQEYHPNGGFRKTIKDLEVAQDLHNQRDHAPYVLWYADRAYYEKIAANT